MAKERVAVIGGSGFLGGFLVRDLLAAGFDVVIGDTAPSAAYPHLWRECDVRRPDTLRAVCEKAGAVINLAAAHRDDVRPLSLYQDINVKGARNVCAVAAECGIGKIIFTSSVAVYGLSEGEADEITTPRPFNPYGQTKLAAEEVYTDWHRDDPARALTIVRPTVIFGPGNRGNVHTLVDQIARNRFVMIGKGENRKSMAYVENVSAFIVHALGGMKPGRQLYNYVDKPDMSMNELVAFVARVLGRPVPSLRLPYGVGVAAGAVLDVMAALIGKSLPISRVRVQKFCANTVFRAGLVRATGFKAPFDLTAALERTIAHEFPKEPGGTPQA